MTRQEHLEWCKQRALEYVDKGDNKNAFASFQSDMGKHPDTANNSALKLGMMLLIGGHLSSQSQMKQWIIGFN